MGVYGGPERIFSTQSAAGRSLYSPGVVQDGLVLNLDAGKFYSYPKSGITWTNLLGSGNIGTLTNGPTYSSVNGGAIVFDGSNDYVNVGNLGSFYSQGTISFWMNSSSVVNYKNPFSTHYLGGNVGIRFEQNTTTSFIVSIGNDSASQAVYDYLPGSNITANTWYNVVLVWNTSTNNVVGYLNGTEKFNSTHTVWPTTLPSISIGSGFDVNRYFAGSIPQVSIYNKALSAIEVTQNYNALKGRYYSIVTSGLTLALDAANTASYPGSGTTWYDISGNNANGTLVSSPTYSSVGGGSIYFNGSNYMSSTVSGSYLDMSIAFYIPSRTGLMGIICSGYNNDQSLRLGWFGGENFFYTGGGGDYNGSPYMVNGVQCATVLNDGWNIVSGYRTNQSSWPISYPLHIACSYPGRWLVGYIGCVYLYNRQLTVAERWQNYNALRGRYGV